MQFTFNGDEARVYLDVEGKTLRAVPGESYDLAEAPDSRFVAASPVTAPPAPEVEIDTPETQGVQDVG
jgi:hypothetical protein